MHGTFRKPKRAGVLRRLRRHQGGGVAVVMTLLLPFLIAGIGLGIDYGMMAWIRSGLIGAVDATSQQLTMEINLCLDKERTDGGKKQDFGCFNAAQMTLKGKPLQARAQELVSENFKIPRRQATVYKLDYDKEKGRVDLAASSPYTCMLVHLIVKSGCDVTLASSTKLENAFVQANPLILADAFGEMREGRQMPEVTLSATGGWKPYTFMGSNLPAGLQVTADGKVKGMPPTIPCLDPTCPPRTALGDIAVTDSGDQNRSGINVQRDDARITLTHIHQLRSSLAGDTWLQAEKYTYTIRPTTVGGLKNAQGQYSYECTGLPPSVPGHPSTVNGRFSCDPNTGVIEGQPLLTAAAPRQTGTISQIARDKASASGQYEVMSTITYDYVLPPLYASKDGDLTGKAVGKAVSVNFTGWGGWGNLDVSCSGLPVGLYCSGESRDSAFAGKISGLVTKELSGTIRVTVTDDAGQRAFVDVRYDFQKGEPTGVRSRGNAVVARAWVAYASVHCKWGCYGGNWGGPQAVDFTFGANAEESPCARNIHMCVTANGTALRKEEISMAQVEYLRDKAREMCVPRVWDRQDTKCDKIDFFDIIETNGVWDNADPVPPRPEKCFFYKQDNGWHINIKKGVVCYPA